MANDPRIVVDRSVCIGSGECVRLAPAVYDLDDEGLAFVTDAAAGSGELLRETERQCPSRAIHVVESNREESP